MALVWRYGQAYTAIEHGIEQWESLIWTVEEEHAGWKIRGEFQQRELVALYLRHRDFTLDQVKDCVEALRARLLPVPTGQYYRPYQWVEEGPPLDRCTPGFHVWPPSPRKPDDFCYCGQRHLREARRGA